MLIDSFFPQDTSDNAFQREVRLDSLTAPDTDDDDMFSDKEIAWVIDKQNDKKAPGYDGLSANIIKHAFSAIPTLFIELYNKCLELGVFPQIWKFGIVKIISKSTNKTGEYRSSNLRPITLLPVMGKILEKLIIDRVMYNIQSHVALTSNQYGFMPVKSTEDAVNKVVQWMKSIH